MTAAGQEGERLVTDEMVMRAVHAYEPGEGILHGFRAALAAVAPDLDRAGYDRARRECADELRAALVPTDRGFVRADDPETTRWMQGWDEATAAARALAIRWSSEDDEEARPAAR